MTIYTTGTVSVTNGDAVVTGSGTAWAVALIAGGMFSSAGMSVPILSVDSDTSLTLAYDWPGTTATGAVYAIARENSEAADIVDLNDRLSRVLVTLSLVGITPNASGTIAERDALTLAVGDKGFLFLHAELGYDFEFYRWSGSAWEGPFATRGVQGASGLIGVWRGPWLTATSYFVNDAVSQGGSSYICVTAHTSGTFATDLAASKWQLVAQKGDTGAVGANGANGVVQSIVAGSNVTVDNTDPANPVVAASGGGFVNSFAKTPAADGVTDDVAALVALEAGAEEVIRLKNASYYIGTNYTPGKTLRFASGTKFLVANGVTVDFSQAEPEIHAPKKQRFYLTGSGAIAGLQVSHAGWFAGDKLSTANNALTELQKWADSAATGGHLVGTLGYYTSDGSSYIDCSKGQQVVGKGRGNSKIRFSGTSTKGFKFSTTSHGSIEHFGFERLASMIVPTAGECVLFDNGTSQIRGRANFIYTSGCFVGVKAASGWVSVTNLLAVDTRYSAIDVEGTNETHAQDCILAANSSWITLTGVTGTFQNGETVTFTGGSGTILTDGAGNYKATFTATQPTIGLVLTGSTSGATGTLATRLNGHSAGGIRVFGRCDASLFEQVEVSGGDYALFMDANSTATSDRNLATVFVNCLLDSAVVAAASVNKSTGTKFIGCWFSSFGTANGVFLSDTITTILQDCQWTYVGLRCVLANTNAIDTKILGGLMADVNASNTANIAAIHFINGTTGTVRDIRVGVNLGYGPNNPARGVQVDSGAVVTLDNVDASTCAIPIVDSATGTIIRSCPGAKTNNQGASSVAIGASTAVVNHGLGFTPAISDIRITPTSSLAASSLTTYWVSAVTATTFTVTTNANAAGAIWSFGWEARIKGA